MEFDPVPMGFAGWVLAIVLALGMIAGVSYIVVFVVMSIECWCLK